MDTCLDPALPSVKSHASGAGGIWVNAVDEWERDSRGNDLKPKQVKAP